MRHQIVGKWSLLGYVTHEHGDGATHSLIDINDEHFLIVPEENCAPAARRQNRPHLHLDHRLVHRINSTCANRKHKLCAGCGSIVRKNIESYMKIFSFYGLECSAH